VIYAFFINIYIALLPIVYITYLIFNMDKYRSGIYNSNPKFPLDEDEEENNEPEHNVEDTFCDEI
jgi:hypothetical protein